MATNALPTSPAWRDNAFVSTRRAAEILGYSVGTIRRLIFCDGLKAVRLAQGGPMLVTVESLASLVDSAEAVSPTAARSPTSRTVGRSHLRLVDPAT